MSWQSYVDDQLLAAGFMYASINGEDCSTWACSEGFFVSPEETTQFFKVLRGTSLDAFTGNGFTVAGQRYTMTRGEVNDDDGQPSYVQGRCKEDNKSAQGVIVFLTSTAIIVGVHDPNYSNGQSFGKVNTEIGRIADYMIENGF